MTPRALRRDTNGSTAVEFAVVSGMLGLVLFAIIETSLLWWMKSGLQTTAALTARCAAIGYSLATSTCKDTASTQAYAVATSQAWVFPNDIATSNVTLNGRVTTCNGQSGTFFSLSINSSYFAFLPPPLSNITLSTNACYAMP